MGPFATATDFLEWLETVIRKDITRTFFAVMNKTSNGGKANSHLKLVGGIGFLNASPHERKALVETEFLPHFKPFFSTECSAFYEPVYAAMVKTVFVSLVVESIKLS